MSFFMTTNRPILVTGGAGFIGSNIIKKLNKSGLSNILIVEDIDNCCLDNLTGLQYVDMVDFRSVINDLHKIDSDNIIHQGAIVDTTYQDVAKILYYNYFFSQRLADYVLDSGAKLIYASSASVYGHNRDKTEKPLNYYSISKYIFDKYVRSLLKEYSADIIGLRYFNVYGPGENHKGRMASVIYHSLKANQKDISPKMFEGSENYYRDFIFVSDVAEIVSYCLTHSVTSGIYDCGTGVARNFKDAITLSSNIEPTIVPFPDDLKNQYQKYTCADQNDLIKLGYKQSLKSLEDGIAEYRSVGV